MVELLCPAGRFLPALLNVPTGGACTARCRKRERLSATEHQSCNKFFQAERRPRFLMPQRLSVWSASALQVQLFKPKSCLPLWHQARLWIRINIAVVTCYASLGNIHRFAEWHPVPLYGHGQFQRGFSATFALAAPNQTAVLAAANPSAVTFAVYPWFSVISRGMRWLLRQLGLF